MSKATVVFSDGRKATIEASSPAEIEAAVLQYEKELKAKPNDKKRSMVDRLIGGAEVAASLASGAGTEPLAGIGGLGSLAANIASPNAGVIAGETVGRVRREGLFGLIGGTYSPRTEAGREYVQAVGNALAPVGEGFDKAGKFYAQRAEDLTEPLRALGVLNDQGSAAVMAAAETIPTAAATLAGYKPAKGTGYVPQGISNASSVVEAGRRAGVPVLTSDVMPPTSFVGKSAQRAGERVPLVGTQGARTVQQEARQAAVSNFVNQYDNFSYQTIVDDLKANSDRVKRAAGNVLESTGNKLDNVGQVTPVNADAASKAARSVLTRPNVAGMQPALAKLDEIDDFLSKPQTFTTLKENRTALSALIDNADPAARSQLPSFAKKQLEGVRAALTKDMEDFARTNLTPVEFGKWKKANAVYADQAKALTKTRLKSVLDTGAVSPESVETMLFSSKPSEVARLYTSLTPVGRQNARSAIISKVVRDLDRRVNGMTPTAFANEMKKYEGQISVFFKGQEAKQLEGLRRVLEATKRAQESGVATPTGQELVTLLAGGAIAIEPATSAGVLGTIGGLSRLYESAPVRNALLRLANAPPKTPVFDAALQTATATLAAAAQSIADQEEAEPARQQRRQ